MKLKNDNRMTILFLSWRDIKAPKKGGAEIFTHEMMKRINKDKFRIIHFSPMYANAESFEEIDGVVYIRSGNIFTVIIQALKFYKENKNKINYVVDQCNTHRFFTKFWVEKEKRIFLIYQLTREIWNINMSFPMNKIGMVLEDFMLRLNRNDWTLTISESTKKDLQSVGFDKEKINILPVGVGFDIWNRNEFLDKEDAPTFIYVGRYAKYKGIDVSIEALGKIKNEYPNAKLWIVGKPDNNYIEKSLVPICKEYNLTYGSRQGDFDVIFLGFVSEEEKRNLMSKSLALICPSIREGWGLIITEAAVVGTPSIVFNNPGIVDAVNFGDSGYVCEENTSKSISEKMKSVIEEKVKYQEIREGAYKYSSQFNWDNTTKVFTKFIEDISK